MTPEYQPPAGTSWQARIIQVFVVVMLIILVFVGLTRFAQRLASGISNESTATTAVVAGNEVEFEIESGSTARVIGSDLVTAGIIADAAEFQSAVRSRGVADQLKAGNYTLVTGSELDELIDLLVAGPDPSNVYTVTVVEGLTIDAVVESIAEQTPYNAGQLTAPLLNGTVDSPYLPDEAPEGSEELVRWEGLLAPDTYEFRSDASPAEILGLMADTLAERVSGQDWSVLRDLGLDSYEGLIVASLIEREVKLDEERPLVASVITNRLESGIALQIDATIIYALGENKGEVTTADLEVESPYNTYLYPGLPPTPIGGVRIASLEAAASPAETEYFYYVLIDTDGTHGFSRTLEEHNEKVEAAKEAGVLTP
jgi:UPF0755 protein